MRTEDKDKLKSLFQEMKVDEPSVSFESRLMQQIHLVAAKEAQKKRRVSMIAMVGGILGVLVLPILIFTFFGVSYQVDFQYLKLNMPAMEINPVIISVATVAVLLLMSDLLIRRRIWEKKHKN
jgi:protein-S-isoprenylcysteine O-methyltransferase Ste14